MGRRELVDLLSLSFWCHVMVVWLLLAVLWVCLRYVIVVFSDHTHLLFLDMSKRVICARYKSCTILYGFYVFCTFPMIRTMQTVEALPAKTSMFSIK